MVCTEQALLLILALLNLEEYHSVQNDKEKGWGQVVGAQGANKCLQMPLKSNSEPQLFMNLGLAAKDSNTLT